MGKRLTAQAALDFRRPMQVRKAVRYRSGGVFPLCPRCGAALEREYQGFCDRCGQKLGWRKYNQTLVVST